MENHNHELTKRLYSAASELSVNSSPSTASPSESKKLIMLALWKRMREYFGQSWVREYGDVDGEAIKAWEDALKGFTEQQIARGVKWCQKWKKDFPPNLGQFQELCLTVRPEERQNVTEKRTAEEKRTGKSTALMEHLSRAATSETAKRELERMHRILRGETIPQ